MDEAQLYLIEVFHLSTEPHPEPPLVMAHGTLMSGHEHILPMNKTQTQFKIKV